jgi:hypothetical protein
MGADPAFRGCASTYAASEESANASSGAAWGAPLAVAGDVWAGAALRRVVEALAVFLASVSDSPVSR